MPRVVERQSFSTSEGERCASCYAPIALGAVVVEETVGDGEKTVGSQRVCVSCASRPFLRGAAASPYSEDT